MGGGDGLLHCSACGVLNPWKFVAQRLRARQRASHEVHVLLIYFDSVTDNLVRWACLLLLESFGLILVSTTSCYLVVWKKHNSISSHEQSKGPAGGSGRWTGGEDHFCFWASDSARHSSPIFEAISLTEIPGLAAFTLSRRSAWKIK